MFTIHCMYDYISTTELAIYWSLCPTFSIKPQNPTLTCCLEIITDKYSVLDNQEAYTKVWLFIHIMIGTWPGQLHGFTS